MQVTLDLDLGVGSREHPPQRWKKDVGHHLGLVGLPAEPTLERVTYRRSWCHGPGRRGESYNGLGEWRGLARHGLSRNSFLGSGLPRPVPSFFEFALELGERFEIGLAQLEAAV